MANTSIPPVQSLVTRRGTGARSRAKAERAKRVAEAIERAEAKRQSVKRLRWKKTNGDSRPVVTRKAAQAAGLTLYWTGLKCRNGHVAERYTANSTCVECQAASNLRRLLADTNPTKAHLREAAVAKLKAAVQREQRRAHEREYLRAWRHNNREAARAHEHAYRARKIGADGRFSAEDIMARGEAQRWRCAYCAKRLGQVFHVDHVVPLSRGGSNDRGNLALACPPCNVGKKDQDPIAFARKMGRLL